MNCSSEEDVQSSSCPASLVREVTQHNSELKIETEKFSQTHNKQCYMRYYGCFPTPTLNKASIKLEFSDSDQHHHLKFKVRSATLDVTKH